METLSFSEVIFGIVHGYNEINNFKMAIQQHQNYVELLKTEIERVNERIKKLKEAETEGIYKTPSELDDKKVELGYH
jgi:prefoldin subunit 5